MGAEGGGWRGCVGGTVWGKLEGELCGAARGAVGRDELWGAVAKRCGELCGALQVFGEAVEGGTVWDSVWGEAVGRTVCRSCGEL